MKNLPNQRWRNKRDSYRPPDEVINPADYEVAVLKDCKRARAFVLDNHYSSTFPQTISRFGLFRHDQLVGVATFGLGANPKSLAVFPGAEKAALELNRFTLLDDVPGNGETWFLARCFELLRRDDLTAVISFSDPMPRHNDLGRLIFPGHIGTIYQSANGNYLGRSKPARLRLLPDGTVFSSRAIAKIRARIAGKYDKCQGWEYATAILTNFGASQPPAGSNALNEWLTHWLEEITTPMFHPGNHKYCWVLNPRYRHYLGKSKPYPKWVKQRSWMDIVV